MLPTTKKVELIEKKEFVVAALNLKHKVFIIDIVALNISFDTDNKMYPSKKA